MTLVDFPELKRLPRKQRLKIAEELWDSAANDSLPVPESHKQTIRSRRAAFERGELGTVTMDELRRSIRRSK
jgi:putative addiction module component (TIGR02574 family)